MSARAIAIHGNEMSGERRANLEIKSECPALKISNTVIPTDKDPISYINIDPNTPQLDRYRNVQYNDRTQLSVD